MGQMWTVIDWTILVIIFAIIIVAVFVALIFCCCIGKTREDEEKEAIDKAEEQWKNKDYMEFKKDENLRLASLGAGESIHGGDMGNDAPAAMEGGE
mmetsp:Transcript_5863/g.9473  ORF Transcript_5863/g.9473 Transcript_5863/m.9473 type:complete len:96 (+) Transcript_5863:318-605(+)